MTSRKTAPVYFECPDVYNGICASIFLAGGITGCPDWQASMKNYIATECPGLNVLNPRRASFDVKDQSAHKEQITWEFNALNQATAILFWFPCETVCPITLYELGVWAVKHNTKGAKIMVGCHRDYVRRTDVKTQLSLEISSDFVVHDSLEDLFGEVRTWWNEL